MIACCLVGHFEARTTVAVLVKHKSSFDLIFGGPAVVAYFGTSFRFRELAIPFTCTGDCIPLMAITHSEAPRFASIALIFVLLSRAPTILGIQFLPELASFGTLAIALFPVPAFDLATGGRLNFTESFEFDKICFLLLFLK